MAPPQKVTNPSNAQTKAIELQKDSRAALRTPNSLSSPNTVSMLTERARSQRSTLQDIVAAANSIEQLSITSEAPLEPSLKEPSTGITPVTNGMEDDCSHLSSSSTKPASFDTKSMASENTFAMDEKESLRPDDSASVQAADEDEPFFVPPVSGRPELQIALDDGNNSDLRRPLLDGPIATGHAAQRLPMTILANPPRFGDIIPNASPALPSNGIPLTSYPARQNGVDSLQQYSAGPNHPDEKIIEAMGTPKDRLLLLQLEEKFHAFIAQSRYLPHGKHSLSSHLPSSQRCYT